MGIIAFIVIGFLAGLIARALMPGNQSMGLIATALLGIVGSFVGGMVSTLFVSDGRMFDLHATGLIWSVVGAIVVLFIAGLVTRRRSV